MQWLKVIFLKMSDMTERRKAIQANKNWSIYCLWFQMGTTALTWKNFWSSRKERKINRQTKSDKCSDGSTY